VLRLLAHQQCTVTVNDGLDLLAEFMGVKEQVAALTNQVPELVLLVFYFLDRRKSLM